MEKIKTEYQKMLDGELYFSSDPDLARRRNRVRSLLDELQGAYNDDQERIRVTKEILGAADDSTYIKKNSYFSYGSNTFVGKNFYMNVNCTILDCAKVTIGNNVMFAPNVQIYAATQPLNAQERISGLNIARPITIGNNVWIGGGVIVLPGVKIGSGTVIGAGAVVTRNVPDNAVVTGNPAKVIKHIQNS